ncbi:MAG TPA: MBL fold metallo-hydrolase, partial [Nitrososphaerales archaeon]|nr:MBL fold metallo-hydrolase [Nitrososphaerales archaeon]
VMPSDVRYVVPTHVHLDHAGAAGRLLREMPNAQVVAHELSVPHLVDPTKLIASATRVFGEETMALYGTPEPIPSGRVTATGEESTLDLGGGTMATLVHAPGHAPHQIAVSLDDTGALLTADAVGIVYPSLNTLIPTTPPPAFNPAELVATVNTLRQGEPKELLVPHFGTRKDVDWVFDQTVEKVQAWVEKVRSLVKGGIGVDEISALMEKEVIAEASVTELPTYGKVSVRTSVKGIVHYLSKNP